MKNKDNSQNRERRVLFVDDEPNIIDVVRKFFKLFNIDASFAKDGFEAIGLCKKHKFRVVFIDYLMPGKNGLETAKIIREILPDAYIVLISGWWTQFAEYELKPFDEILGKPFELASLVNIIDRVEKKECVPALTFAKITFEFNQWRFTIIGNRTDIAYIGIPDRFHPLFQKRLRIMDDPSPLERFVIELGEYFQGNRKAFSYRPTFLHGTDFQKFVWNNLARIPYGETITYSNFASMLGLDKACARAVGNACAKNPVPIVAPCHRVIRSDGSLGGYSLGIELKRFLLELERKNRN